MQILTYENTIQFIGEITKGIFPEADPNRELYKIINEGQTFYSVTNNLELHEIVEIPAEVEPHRWCYTLEDSFYPNPGWAEPPKSNEARIAELEAQNEELSVALDTLLTEVIPSMMV